MKANRKFVMTDEAVSPVIAVILMVAITVVLAATVFVLVSNIGGETNIAPTVKLTTDETADRLVVDSADSKADWNRLSIRLTSFSSSNATIRIGGVASCDTSTAGCQNVAGDAVGKALTNNTNVEIGAGSDSMGPGEFLAFCYDNTAITPKDVAFTVVDTTANTKVGDFKFLEIGTAC